MMADIKPITKLATYTLLVIGCGSCPHSRNHEGGWVSVCEKTGKTITTSRGFPEWCPLEDADNREEEKTIPEKPVPP